MYARSGTSWLQQAMMEHPPPENGYSFGFAVALSSTATYLAVGRPSDQAGFPNNDKGSVTIYVRSGATWDLQVTIVKADAQGGDRFGRYLEMKPDATYLAVATDAPKRDNTISIYKRTGNTRKMQKE